MTKSIALPWPGMETEPSSYWLDKRHIIPSAADTHNILAGTLRHTYHITPYEGTSRRKYDDSHETLPKPSGHPVTGGLEK